MVMQVSFVNHILIKGVYLITAGLTEVRIIDQLRFRQFVTIKAFDFSILFSTHDAKMSCCKRNVKYWH